MKKFVLIGNDKRFLYLEKLLIQNGYKKEAPGDIVVVAPRVDPREGERFLRPGGIIVGGKGYSYSKEYTIRNSQLTAEAALAIAIDNTSFSLKGSSVTVLGFGYLGKAVAYTFAKNGANVTVVSRKQEDLRFAGSRGYKAQYLENFSKISSKIVINTIPAKVLDGRDIICMPDILFIELASVSAFSENEYGFRVIDGGGLPGKYAPETAGRNLYEEIVKLCQGDYV